ncbi:MAG: GNAT family N-acetyltransferase [Acidobacteria bacterium]|nr:GNAT family N-acetyltransferase [Acidobacteriota bacterium]
MLPVEYRDLTPDDIPAGLRLCRIAGWNQLAADWDLFLRLSPSGCRAAVRDGQVVGTVTTVNYENRFAWVGMVLVDPEVRGHGVGTQLLKEAMNVLQGIPAIRLDATPQGRPVYQRLGFVDEYELSRMQLAEASAYGNQPNSVQTSHSGFDKSSEISLHPMQPSDLGAVVDADRRVFGADRGEILRWALEQSPEYAWMATGPSGLEGYCLGRHGFNFDQIGPVHSQAEFVSQQLVMACLSSARPGARMILDPLHHSPAWLDWLQRAGFVHQRPFTRMVLGENRYPGSPGEMWTMFGPEFG